MRAWEKGVLTPGMDQLLQARRVRARPRTTSASSPGDGFSAGSAMSIAAQLDVAPPPLPPGWLTEGEVTLFNPGAVR